MSTIFVKSQNRKKFDKHSLSINLNDKIDIRRVDNCLALRRTYKGCTETIHLEQQEQRGIKILDSLMDFILDYFKYINKKHETLTDNTPVKIYLKKVRINYIQD